MWMRGCVCAYVWVCVNICVVSCVCVCVCLTWELIAALLWKGYIIQSIRIQFLPEAWVGPQWRTDKAGTLLRRPVETGDRYLTLSCPLSETPRHTCPHTRTLAVSATEATIPDGPLVWCQGKDKKLLHILPPFLSLSHTHTQQKTLPWI